MGNIKQTGLVNTVNIGGGGSKGGSEALVLGACLLVGAWVVVGVAAAVISALTILLIWMSVVLGLAIVLAVVLAIVFRKQIKRNFGGPRLVHVGEHSLLNMPDRDMPKIKAPEPPREIIHTHRHYVIGPTGLTSEMPGWDRLVEAELLPLDEHEIAP